MTVNNQIPLFIGNSDILVKQDTTEIQDYNGQATVTVSKLVDHDEKNDKKEQDMIIYQQKFEKYEEQLYKKF